MKKIASSEAAIVDDLASDFIGKVNRALKHAAQFVEPSALAIIAFQGGAFIVGAGSRLLSDNPDADRDHVDVEAAMLTGLILARIAVIGAMNEAITAAYADMDALKAASRWPTGVASFRALAQEGKA